MPTMRAVDFDAWMEAAVGEVLESMCFVSVSGPAPVEPEGQNWIACRLHFFGDPNGSFGIRAPEPISKLIAANFLGEDEWDLSAEQVVEVMCEVSNMICGAILGQLNPKRTFSLSSPLQDLEGYTSESETAMDADMDRDRIWRNYALDEGTVSTWFEVEAS